MQRRPGWFIAGFLAPALLLYVGLVLFPLQQAVQISFFQWRGTSSVVKPAGTSNYQQVMRDPVFYEALGNNAWMAIVVGLVVFAVAMLAAHALKKRDRPAKILDALVLVPMAVSSVVAALLWQFMFHPQMGPVPELQKLLGLGEFQSGWLATPAAALPAVGVALAWLSIGFYVVLFGAGMQQIPGEVMESADMDGIPGWAKFWRITWPLLWTVRRTAVIYWFISVMNTFAIVYLMTKGGPDHRTEVMLTYLYITAVENSQYGYGSALAVVNLVLVLAISGLLMWLMRRDPTEARA